MNGIFDFVNQVTVPEAVQIFCNDEMGLQMRAVLNDDGSISVNAEDTAIGFGWCRTEVKNGKEYRSVMWSRMNKFCKEFGFAHECAKDDYIPESLFYMLGMKASNERAQKFQRWLAIDVIPQIRKTGHYEMPGIAEKAYPPKASSLSEVGNFMRMVREVMEKQGCTAMEVAAVMKETCLQFGITLPEMFVRPEMGFAAFVSAYHKETGKRATYQDYTAYKSAFTRRRRKRR